MSILFLILKIIGILILIPIVLLLILLIFPICYQIEGDFDGKSPKAQVKVSWAVIFLRAKAFYEEELNFGIRILGIPIYDSRKEHWSVFGEHKKKDKKKHKKRSDSKKKQKNKKNNKKRVEKKKSTYPSEDEDVFNLTWDEKEERTKTSTTRKMYERSEDKISESKIDKTTDKEKEFFGKRIVNFLKKCYNRCKNFITKIRKITNKMEMIGDLLEDEDIIDAVKRIKEIWSEWGKAVTSTETKCKDHIWIRRPILHGKSLRLDRCIDSNLR